jgi:hypothetical protein
LQALLLNGQKFCSKHRGCVCSGFPVLVKPAEAEKNYLAQAEAAGGSAQSGMYKFIAVICGPLACSIYLYSQGGDASVRWKFAASGHGRRCASSE